MNNRDFKGVWIPKEIWLRKDLNALDKMIFDEIDSLDNENHCTAGNEYFAEFCQCSESKVTKTVKKLIDLGLVEQIHFDGRHRKLRVVKNTIESSKKYEAESQNLQSNNIDNKQENKKNNSKELLQNQEFQFGKQKPKKESLFTKCISLLDSFIDEHNCGNNVRRKLISYLNYRISIQNRPLYTNMWKGMLNKLEELHKEGNTYESIIDYCLERGYLSFYAPNNNYSNRKNQPWEQGVTCERYTEDELAELEALNKEREAKGMRTTF